MGLITKILMPERNAISGTASRMLARITAGFMSGCRGQTRPRLAVVRMVDEDRPLD